MAGGRSQNVQFLLVVSPTDPNPTPRDFLVLGVHDMSVILFRFEHLPTLDLCPTRPYGRLHNGVPVYGPNRNGNDTLIVVRPRERHVTHNSLVPSTGLGTLCCPCPPLPNSNGVTLSPSPWFHQGPTTPRAQSSGVRAPCKCVCERATGFLCLHIPSHLPGTEDKTFH